MSYYQPQPAAQNNAVKSLIWNLNYMYKDKVERKCAELMSHTSINKPSTEIFTHSNGVKQKLLKIFGLLPITYNNVTYNIPVCFRFPYQFPDRPPMCYVVPTPQMSIKSPHKHVNKEGFVFHPYLSNWSPYTSNLIPLFTNLCSVFGKDPPVYAKQAKPSPKNYGRVEEPPSYHNAFNAYNRSVNQAQPGARGGPYGQPYAKPAPYIDIKPPSYAAAQGSPQPGAAPSYVQSSPPSYNNVSQRPPTYDQTAAIAGKSVLSSDNSGNRKDTLTREVKKKLHAELTRLHERWVDEVNELQRLERDLKMSKQEIEKMQFGIEGETRQLKKLKIELETANVKMQSWLEENRDSPPVDLLKTVEPQDVWTKQLIQAVAQDSGIDDTLYCLDRALGDDGITLKNYLKQVRKLTREQFFKRALVQKICQKQMQLRERNERSPHWQPWNVDLS